MKGGGRGRVGTEPGEKASDSVDWEVKFNFSFLFLLFIFSALLDQSLL